MLGHGGQVNSVTWSPDQSKIASGSDDNTIKIWNAATAEHLGTLYGHAGSVNSVAWSPDGTKIASASADWTVRIWDAWTGELIGRPLVSDASALSVVWSPNGDEVAAGVLDGTVSVWAVNNGGGLALRLAGHAARVNSVAWSPDASKIAFHSTRNPPPPSPPPGSNRFEIYTMNADGSHQTRLTNNTFQDTFPMWSPDGTRLAFTSNRDGPSSNFEVYTMNPDGTDVRRVTDSPAGQDSHSSWSPDGSQLTFHSARTGGLDIYRTNADGSGVPTRLTFTAGFEAFPVWSPDGTRITFSDLSSPGLDIFHVGALDGGDLTRLTTDPGSDNRCDWQTLLPVGVPTPVPGPATTIVSGSTSTGTPPTGGDRPGPPLVELGGAATQKLGSTIEVVAESDEQATLQADGTIAAPKTVAKLNAAQRKAKSFRLPGVQADAPPRAKVTLRLQVPRKAISAIKRRLTRGRRSTARIKVVATDVAGNQRTVFRTIRITR